MSEEKKEENPCLFAEERIKKASNYITDNKFNEWTNEDVYQLIVRIEQAKSTLFLKCGIIILDYKNKTFIVTQSYNNLWGIPKGIQKESWEDPTNTAIRETHEETGILFKNVENPICNKHKNFIFYLKDIGDHKINPNVINNETTGIAWICLSCYYRLIKNKNIFNATLATALPYIHREFNIDIETAKLSYCSNKNLCEKYLNAKTISEIEMLEQIKIEPSFLIDYKANIDEVKVNITGGNYNFINIFIIIISIIVILYLICHKKNKRKHMYIHPPVFKNYLLNNTYLYEYPSSYL
jgi:hypothetical protein